MLGDFPPRSILRENPARQRGEDPVQETQRRALTVEVRGGEKLELNSVGEGLTPVPGKGAGARVSKHTEVTIRGIPSDENQSIEGILLGLLERGGHRAEQNCLVSHGEAVVVDVKVLDPAPPIRGPYLSLKYAARNQGRGGDEREDAAQRDPAGFIREETMEN
eukprot:8365406-Pyramimonas_sp.AAC.1